MSVVKSFVSACSSLGKSVNFNCPFTTASASPKILLAISLTSSAKYFCIGPEVVPLLY